MSSAQLACPRVRHLVTGTFNTAALHLLAFDTLTHTLTISRSIFNAKGPHQYLASGTSGPRNTAGLGPAASSSGPSWTTVYATTWAQPPSLSAWAVFGLDPASGSSIEDAGNVDLKWLSTVPITATSSYVHVQPPPFHSLTAPGYGVDPGPSRHLYSAGGPTGEVHVIDPKTGALFSTDGKIQELVFLREGEAGLAKADKSRKALRYGAHSVDVSIDQLAFVADLGRNAILTYRRDALGGRLTLLSETASPREGDGPRHVVPSPDGRWVFSVTEHTSFVDVFELINKDSGSMRHRLSLDILPPGATRSSFRGDTVRLSPSGRAVLASTRGKTPATRGWVTAWDLEGLAVLAQSPGTASGATVDLPLLTRWQTPTSGGKANAIEWAPRYESASDWPPPADGASASGVSRDENDWAVLTDDAEGWVLVLRWNGRDLEEVARTRLPGRGQPELGEGEREGASHAIWLS